MVADRSGDSENSSYDGVRGDLARRRSVGVLRVLGVALFLVRRTGRR